MLYLICYLTPPPHEVSDRLQRLKKWLVIRIRLISIFQGIWTFSQDVDLGNVYKGGNKRFKGWSLNFIWFIPGISTEQE